MIYDFENGKVDRYFRSVGVNKRNVESVFNIIKDIDFTHELNMGNAVLDSSGAYVTDKNGERQPVYFYKSSFWFYYGDDPIIKYPKFHILRCETINTHTGFAASNTRTAKVRNKNNSKGDRYYEVEMKLCKNCAKSASSPYRTTAEFYEALEKKYEANRPKKKDVKIDLDGYVLEWSIISKNYRKSKKFQCESCNIELSKGRRFLHVHHKNHDKLDNRPRNLESLCVLCHKHQDKMHELNFEVGKMKRQIEHFIQKYKQQLVDCGNPYIHHY